jgi:hypothetical protein
MVNEVRALGAKYYFEILTAETSSFVRSVGLSMKVSFFGQDSTFGWLLLFISSCDVLIAVG